MGQGEVRLEIGPSFVGVGLAFPGFAIVQEHGVYEEELNGGGDDLGGRIESIAGGGIVEGVFDLAEEAFDWLIGIVGSIESYVAVLEVGCQDGSIFGIKTLTDVVCGYI